MSRRTGPFSLQPVRLILLALFGLITFVACGQEDPANPASQTGEPTMSTVKLQVQTVDVLIAESSPPQGSAHVSAIIPDSCTKAREPEISRDGSTITVTIIGERPEGVACAQVISSYDKSIPLGTLDPGRYTLHVNNVTKDFEVS